MLNLSRTNRFKKDIALLEKQGKDMRKLSQIIAKLATGVSLEDKFRNHKLKGDYVDHWECHIEPDWLLIYKRGSEELILVRTGSHSDLF